MGGCSRCGDDDTTFGVITGGRPTTVDRAECPIATRFAHCDRGYGGAAERNIFHSADVTDEAGARSLRDHQS